MRTESAKGATRGNILILGTQVPFTSGGAELLCENLRQELLMRDYCVDIVQLPFSASPKEVLLRQVSLWRALELNNFAGRKVDLVIASKFPSYMAQHPNKIVWLIHQHRQLYELYGTRFGDFSADPEDESLRRLLLDADRVALTESKQIFTISPNVTNRLKRYLQLDSKILSPPLPLKDRYYSRNPQAYILSVGRICSIKRVDLIIKALPQINDALRLKIVGVFDEPEIETYLQNEIAKHHLWHRVEFLGKVSEEVLLKLFAEAFTVFYAPFDEDYGFVALESLRSGKPVLTASDSGGVLEFLVHEKNALICEPKEEALASAINRMWHNPMLYQTLSEGAGTTKVDTTWDEVVSSLTESL